MFLADYHGLVFACVSHKVICDLLCCLFGELLLIVDYLFRSNPRAMFKLSLPVPVVYFKPTCNVQTYVNLR